MKDVEGARMKKEWVLKDKDWESGTPKIDTKKVKKKKIDYIIQRGEGRLNNKKKPWDLIKFSS
jgi:hypothetical protein